MTISPEWSAKARSRSNRDLPLCGFIVSAAGQRSRSDASFVQLLSLNVVHWCCYPSVARVAFQDVFKLHGGSLERLQCCVDEQPAGVHRRVLERRPMSPHEVTDCVVQTNLNTLGTNIMFSRLPVLFLVYGVSWTLALHSQYRTFRPHLRGLTLETVSVIACCTAQRNPDIAVLLLGVALPEPWTQLQQSAAL